MASCNKTKGSAVRQARIYVRSCEGEYTPICCLDNVNLTFDNTTRVRQETQDGCVVKDVRTVTSELTYDFYEISNANVLPLMFPSGALSQEGGAVTGAIQTLSEGTWNYSATESFKYLIENRNSDNTIVTITSVVAGVDGALTSGVDYNVVTQEVCLPGGTKYVVSYIEILANPTNIATDEQDLVITYNYTSDVSYKFSLPLGSYASTTQDIRMLAINKQDPTDIIEVIGEGSFSVSGSLFTFADPDAELTAVNASFSFEENTELTISGLKIGNDCGTCA